MVTSDDVGHWNHWASAVLGETQDRPLWVRSPEPVYTLGPPDPVSRVEFLPEAVHPGPDLPCTFTTAQGYTQSLGVLWIFYSGPQGPLVAIMDLIIAVAGVSLVPTECQHFWSSAWMSD